MANGVMEVLIRPDAFFSRLFEGEVSLKVPGLIAAIGAVITAVAAYMISGPTVRMFSEAAGPSTEGFLAGVFHAISAIFKGKGSFRRTLQAGGYGLVPMIIGSAISTLLSLYYIPLIKVPMISSLNDPSAITRGIAQIYADPAMREFAQVSGIVSIIFLIWGANIWIFGMKHARGLSTRNATITVGVPVLILIIYTIATAFFGLGLPGVS
jgi:hypothetical protein